jgi:hypothetical protein
MRLALGTGWLVLAAVKAWAAPSPVRRSVLLTQRSLGNDQTRVYDACTEGQSPCLVARQGPNEPVSIIPFSFHHVVLNFLLGLAQQSSAPIHSSSSTSTLASSSTSDASSAYSSTNIPLPPQSTPSSNEVQNLAAQSNSRYV